MSTKDYYQTLGVKKDATLDEIKAAYRQLARQYHPDLNPGNKEAEEKFKDINEAFSVLSDPQKKAQYDQYGSAAFNAEDVAGFREFKFNFDDLFSDFGFGDIFDVFRGSKRKRASKSVAGADIRYDLEISLENAFNGLETKIEVPLYATCKHCDGNGAEPGYIKTCTQCGGTGEVRQSLHQSFANLINIAPCDVCKGTGRIIEKLCRECNGTGKVYHANKIELKVPPGIEEGAYLRVAGQGEEGTMGGKRGDLYVLIHITPHPIFDRKGDNLFSTITITLTKAVFGCEVRVKTISGTALLTIPPGTQSNSLFRLKGQGMLKMPEKIRGDHYVKVIVETPTNLTPKQRQLLEKFAKEELP